MAVLISVQGASVSAVIIGGGGPSSSDCLLALDAPANFPVTAPKRVVCVDGDPSCDSDLLVNGVCEFRVAACANSTFNPNCTLAGIDAVIVDHSNDNAQDPQFDPDFQALASRIEDEIAPPNATSDTCTIASAIRVPIKGPINGRCRPGKKKLSITTLSEIVAGRVYTDKDKLKMTCLPDPNTGCDAQQLFTGTFDRIQRQIFDQTCALSGCHDSQSVSGGLLLETGASYGNLVGAVPSNPNASAAGWNRVFTSDLVTGDPEMSFLYHKLTGDLPAGYGSRMPLDRPKLSGSLIEIVRLWIENGAPAMGWVPGTDQ